MPRRKTFLENWGKKRLRFGKNALSGLGVTFITIIGVLGLFALVWFGAEALQQFISSSIIARLAQDLRNVQLSSGAPASPGIQNIISSAGQAPATGPAEAGLTHASFSDTFSGEGWINTDATTMHRDNNVTAYVLPPKYEWTEAAASEFNSPGELNSNSACIGSNCLAVVGNFLQFKGAPLALPSALQDQDIANLSVGALDTKFVLGAVANNSGGYAGWVFYFDGKDFTEVIGGGGVLDSPYAGKIYFGGDDGDWLAIYSAYEGRAAEITGGVVNDISRFFGIRVMNGGFTPAVIHQGAWYISSQTAGNPKLLKLFDNGTGKVQGAVDFSSGIFPKGTQSAIFVGSRTSSGSPTSQILIAKVVDSDSAVHYYQFTDDGFDVSHPAIVQSLNLNNYNGTVRSADIYGLDLGSGGGTVQFSFSNNGRDWYPVSVGGTMTFPDQTGRQFLWRAEFTPDGNAANSPFLGSIGLDYYIQPS